MKALASGHVSANGYGAFMRTLLVLDVELDEGKRPSTKVRRVDQVVRSVGGFVARLSHVSDLRGVSVCEPDQAEGLKPELRYDGRRIASPVGELPAGLVDP